MPDTIHADHCRVRHLSERLVARSESGKTSSPCRYCKEFAGFHVCQATSHVAVVTDRDCGKCPVPDTLARVGCFFLRASVTFAPSPQVRWTCGATEDFVEPDAPSGCVGCFEPRYDRPL